MATTQSILMSYVARLGRLLQPLGLGLFLWCTPVAAAIPEALGDLLQQADKAIAAGKQQQALQLLNTWQEPSRGLVDTMRAQIWLRLQQWQKAEAAFKKALQAHPKLRPAVMGLAKTLQLQGQHAQALQLLGQHIDIKKGSAADIAFYATTALEAHDLRLARLIVNHALLRFPADISLRHIDLAVLLKQQDFRGSQDAALQLLNRQPQDPSLWQTLAAATAHGPNNALHLAALEAASLANPDSLNVQHHHLQAQLEAGHHQYAWRLAKALVNEQPNILWQKNQSLFLLVLQTALLTEHAATGQTWLHACGAQHKHSGLQRLGVRLALAQQDLELAQKHIDALVDGPERDVTSLLWAGRIAAQRGDLSLAKMRFEQARHLEIKDKSKKSLAVYYWINILLRQQQRSKAITRLSTYVAQHPQDATAATWLQQLQHKGIATAAHLGSTNE